jgi:iron(II)-dependent oxidoreductase
VRNIGSIVGPLVVALTILVLAACDPPQEHKRAIKALIPDEVQAPKGMVHVPAGPFTMGTDQEDTDDRGLELGLMIGWFDSAHPAHRIDLPGFYMDRTEISNSAYATYVAERGIQPPPHWRGPLPPSGLENHPVTHVSWTEAQGYCAWNGNKTLPTEAQWEKAARGPEALIYPWGNEYNHEAVNVARINTRPVGTLPAGDSPYGLADMTGNVWEWTANWYQPYPGSSYQDDKYGTRFKVLRGNSWASVGHYPDESDFMDIVANNSRTTYRLYLTPKGRLNDVGFRCVKPA